MCTLKYDIWLLLRSPILHQTALVAVCRTGYTGVKQQENNFSANIILHVVSIGDKVKHSRAVNPLIHI